MTWKVMYDGGAWGRIVHGKRRQPSTRTLLEARGKGFLRLLPLEFAVMPVRGKAELNSSYLCGSASIVSSLSEA